MENKIKNMAGLRRPEEQERQAISCYFEKYFSDSQKMQKKMAVLLCVFGVLSMSSFKATGLIVGAVLFALVYSIYSNVRSYRGKIAAFQKGEFWVLEGKVTEFSIHPDYPGVFNARFQSLLGEDAPGWFRVRQEGVQIGTPLLLMYAEKDVMKKDIYRTFTPHVLTEDGLKHCL